MKEYRVVWKRQENRRKVKRYATRPRAERFIALMTSPEPWKLFPTYAHMDPDKPYCCEGGPYSECACGGLTLREHFASFRKDLPPIEYVHIEEREVGKWGHAQGSHEEKR